MSLPRTRTGLQVIRPGLAEIRSDIPYPRLRADYVIAETKAFALNPTDNHHIESLAGTGPIIGCDWSGIVREVGGNVTRFKPGDAVFGVCHGGNSVEPADGAFADIITGKEHTTMHKPEFLSFEKAASLGVGLVTVGQVLYPVMKLPLPSPDISANSGPTLLVYGGSSATGTIAIQVAELSGCRVFATCSVANSELVQSRGAERWFDYNQSDFIEQIAAVGLPITHIVDCIGTEESGIHCSKILASAGGHYHSIKVPVPESFKKARPEESAVATTAMGYTMFGERFEFPGVAEFPADPTMEAFAKEWVLTAENLVQTRQIQPHPVEIRNGGLVKLLDGLQEIRKQPPRGQKIVYSQE